MSPRVCSGRAVTPVQAAALAAVEALEPRRLLAATATLLHDVAPGNVGSNPNPPAAAGGLGYFTTSESAPGGTTYRLYRSDGTDAGTRPVATSTASVTNLTSSGGLVYFDLKQGGISQVWRTDGTDAGTSAVTGFDWSGAATSNYADVAGALYFVGRTSSGGGVELWRSGGTAGTTTRVVDGTRFNSIGGLTNVGGALFFAAAPKASPSDVELWRTDGTDAGTVRVKDISAGATSGSFPTSLTNVNGTLYLLASDASGPGLWRSDGTEAGTVLVAGYGGAGQFSSPQSLTALGDALFFTAAQGTQRYLYRSDGTAAGTRAVAYPVPVGGGDNFNPAALTPFAGRLYFAASTPAHGRELWSTDGTEAGTTRVADVRPGPAGSNPLGLTAAGGALYFSASDGVTGTELWRSDGTAGGTTLVSDAYPGPSGISPARLTALSDGGGGGGGGAATLLFTATDPVHGTEPWASDGTPAGTRLVKDLLTAPVSSNPTMFTPVGDRVFFNGPGGLWVGDGASAHTQFLAASPIDPTGFVSVSGVNIDERYKGLRTTAVVGGILYFRSGGRLWRSDGTPAGTYVVSDAPRNLSCLAPVGNLLYFSAEDGVSGHELWRSDGTAAGTYRVADLNPGSPSSLPRNIIGLNGAAYFTAWERLYRSDGTAAGTVPVTGSLSSGDQAYQFVQLGDLLYFTTAEGLWRSDGTAAGTLNLVAGRGMYLAQYSKARRLGGSTYFLAADAYPGRVPGLWKTDGTPAGTVLVATIGSTVDQRFQPGYDLTVVGGRLFFTGPGGTTLWASDGTAAGTVQVKTFPSAAPAVELTAAGDALYFASGGTLWASDGTPGGTVQVDNDPGPGLAAVQGLAGFGGAVALSAQHPLYGVEPWVVANLLAPPAAPGGLEAVATSAAQIDVSWTDNSGDESGFRLERSADATFATVDRSVLLPPDRTTFADRPLLPGRTYYYRVIAYNRSGDSAPTAVAGATTPDGVPAAPSGLTVRALSATRVRLDWVDNATDETGIVVQRATDPAFAAPEATFGLAADSTSFEDATASPLNRYYYRVFATGPGGNSDYVSAAASTPDRPPADLRVVGVSPSRIDLRWTNASATTASWRVFRRRVGEASSKLIATLPAVQNDYTDLNLPASTAWEYWVTAQTASGDSTSGPVSAATTAPVLTTPVKAIPPVLDHGSGAKPSAVVTSNGIGYFVALDGELWRTDGTEAGTRLVTRLGGIRNLVDVDGTLFFVASEYLQYNAIYKTDGTAAGTVLVKDINVLGNDFVHDLVSFNGKLYFRGTAYNSDSDSLWVSDGTAAGTVELKRFGWRNGGEIYRPMVVSGGKLWLGANEPTGDNTPTLYVSDGTAEGTVRVETTGGVTPTAANVFLPAGDYLYFLTPATLTGPATWWRSDGTREGTTPLTNAPPQRAGQARAVGNTLYLPGHTEAVGWELFQFDPTGTAASLVDDVAAGPADSSPHALTPFAGRLAFFTTDGASVSLRLTGGGGGSSLVRQFPTVANSTVAQAGVLGGALYFFVREPLGSWVLYRSDGTGDGTLELKRFAGATQPGPMTPLGDRLTFAADDGVNGLEVWATDGTPGGTTLLKDVANTPLPTKPDSMVEFKGGIYFTFTPMGPGGRGPIYRTDGTAAGTTLIYDGRASGLFRAGDHLYFTAATPETGVELWRTDGTAAGTHMVADVVPGTTGSLPVPLAWLGDKLIFGVRGPDKYRYELWRTDGTAVGTTKLYGQVLLLDNAYGPAHAPAVLDGVMYFYGEDDPTLNGQLWRTDGTSQGTYQVKAFSAGNANVNQLTVLNGALYFTAFSDTYKSSLWRSDGTPAGTTLVRGNASVNYLSAANGALYFGNDEGLWKSDGTLGGTAVLSTAATNFGRIATVGGLAYFFAAGQLWKTDGTPAGTTAVRGLNLGAYGMGLQAFMVDVGGTLFYSDAYDLWRSDGTFGGTYQVAKIADNSTAQSQMAFTGALAARLGDLLLFGTMTSDGGRELRTAYVTPPAAPAGLATAAPAPAGGSPAPGAPVLATAAAVPAGVALTWEDRSANESGFVIERSDTADFATVSATFFVPADTASYVDATASPGDAYFYRVRAVNAAGASAASNGVTTGPVRLLAADFRFDAPAHSVVLRFGGNVAASLSAGDVHLRNLTTGQDVPAEQLAIAYDAPTNTATVTFAGGRLADGRYRLALASADVASPNGLALDGDGNGTPGGDFALDFFTLAGDANRDGAVNFADLLALARDYGQTARTLAQGDFNGDGTVNFADLLTLAKNYNKALPAPGATAGAALVPVGPSTVPALSEVLAGASRPLALPPTSPAAAAPKAVPSVKSVLPKPAARPTPKLNPAVTKSPPRATARAAVAPKATDKAIAKPVLPITSVFSAKKITPARRASELLA